MRVWFLLYECACVHIDTNAVIFSVHFDRIHRSFRALFPFNFCINMSVDMSFCRVHRTTFSAKYILDHSLGHHSHSVFERLALITEPNSYHFTFVAQLMCKTGYFRPCGIKILVVQMETESIRLKSKTHLENARPLNHMKILPDGCVFRSKWAFSSSNACGVNDVRRFRFFDGSTPIKSVKWLWPLL